MQKVYAIMQHTCHKITRTFPNLGLLGHIHLNSQWAVQPELVYSSQGAKSAGTEQKLDYINVPLLLQYMFDNGFRLQAGPQLGLLVRADNKNDLNSIDLGVGLGAGHCYCQLNA